MKKHILLTIAALSLTAGCMAPIERHDPLAALNTPVYTRNLTAAIVDTENTKQSVQYLRHMNMISNFVSPWTRVDVPQFINTAHAVFERNFKTAAHYDDIAAAKASGADVVVMLDILAEPGNTSFKTHGQNTKISVSAILLTKDEKQIDTVSGKGERPTGMLSFNVEGAADEAWSGLETALRHSDKIAAFSQAGTLPTAGVAAAPPPAPIHSDVDEPTYKRPENSADYALVIGIEGYSSLPAAEFAERDAQAVREHLLALGVPQRNMVYLTGSQADFSGIKKYVETWLPARVKEDSTVYIYYSGHGAPNTKTNEAYLVPFSGDPEFLEDTAYPLKRLYSKLNELKARRVLVALDSCFSGAGGRSVLAKGVRPLISKIDTGEIEGGKIAVLAASAANEISGTIEKEGHGAFTYYFLKGLNGSAEDKNKAVTLQSLYDYLTPKVEDAARIHNRDQTPQLMRSNGDSADVQLR